MIAGVTVHINPNLPWYVARAGGIVAWALVAATVIWGLAFSGKLARHPKLPSPAWTLDLHRFMGGTAVIFTGLHIAGLMLDRFVGYGPFEVMVPFTATYRPVATAWGIVAVYLLLAVELTSLVMARLPRKVWHGVHLSSYVIFTLATVHGLSTGTDARHGVLPLVMVLTAIVVALLTGMRVQIGIAKHPERAQRVPRAASRQPVASGGRVARLPFSGPPLPAHERGEGRDAYVGDVGSWHGLPDHVAPGGRGPTVRPSPAERPRVALDGRRCDGRAGLSPRAPGRLP